MPCSDNKDELKSQQINVDTWAILHVEDLGENDISNKT